LCIISRLDWRAQKKCKQLRHRQSSPDFAPSSFLFIETKKLHAGL
jgi:hypothetical protein